MENACGSGTYNHVKGILVIDNGLRRQEDKYCRSHIDMETANGLNDLPVLWLIIVVHLSEVMYGDPCRTPGLYGWTW